MGWAGQRVTATPGQPGLTASDSFNLSACNYSSTAGRILSQQGAGNFNNLYQTVGPPPVQIIQQQQQLTTVYIFRRHKQRPGTTCPLLRHSSAPRPLLRTAATLHNPPITVSPKPRGKNCGKGVENSSPCIISKLQSKCVKAKFSETCFKKMFSPI